MRPLWRGDGAVRRRRADLRGLRRQTKRSTKTPEPGNVNGFESQTGARVLLRTIRFSLIDSITNMWSSPQDRGV